MATKKKRRRKAGPYRPYSRNQGGVKRWYADFPEFEDVLGMQQGKQPAAWDKVMSLDRFDVG